MDPIESVLSQTEAWVRQNISKLNQEVLSGYLSLDQMVLIIQSRIDILFTSLWVPIDNKLVHLSREQARKAIQLLGFMMSSIEKHFQSQGHQSGAGIVSLSHVESLCDALGAVAKHPPRDSAYTYWIWNKADPPITFTRNPQEITFNRVINNSDQLFTTACDHLRPVCQGQIPILSHEARVAISSATQQLIEAKKEFLSLMEYSNLLSKERNMEPSFFMTEYRTYLVHYPINGTVWQAVNAGNIVSQMQVDYLIGTVNSHYMNHIVGRLVYLPFEYQEAITSDMKLPSILNLIIGCLNMTSDEILQLDDNILAAQIRIQGTALVETLRVYYMLIKAAAALTASHWALIQNYLLKPSNSLTSQDREILTVQPEIGTGGMSMSEIIAVRDMRRKHPLVEKIFNCVGIL